MIFVSLQIFSNLSFSKFSISVLIQILCDILLDRILFQTFCKGYQQMIKFAASLNFNKNQEKNCWWGIGDWPFKDFEKKIQLLSRAEKFTLTWGKETWGTDWTSKFFFYQTWPFLDWKTINRFIDNHCRPRLDATVFGILSLSILFANINLHGNKIIFQKIPVCDCHRLKKNPLIHLNFTCASGCRVNENLDDYQCKLTFFYIIMPIIFVLQGMCLF